MNIKDLLKPFSGLIKKSPIPILEYVVIGAEKIEGTDLETHITVKAPFKFDPVCVEHGRFNKTITALGDTDYEIIVDDKNVIIKTKTGKFTLPHLPAEDYPLPIVDDEVISFDVDEDFINALKSASTFVSKDELRPYLTGIYIEGGDGISIYSSDAHRLFHTKINDTVGNISVIVNPSLPRLAPNSPGRVTIGNQSITFDNGHVKIQSRLVEGNYPSVDAILPKESPLSIAQFNVGNLKSVINQALVYANANTHTIKFFSDDTLKISAVDLEFNTSCLIDTSVKSDINVGLSGRYLLDVLSALQDTDDITMSFWGANKIVLFQNGSKKVYLMPLMIEA